MATTSTSQRASGIHQKIVHGDRISEFAYILFFFFGCWARVSSEFLVFYVYQVIYFRVALRNYTSIPFGKSIHSSGFSSIVTIIQMSLLASILAMDITR